MQECALVPDISYEPVGFARHRGPGLSRPGSIQVSWEDLVWSAVTVGKPGAAHLLTHRWHSIADIIARAHSVYANLRTSGPHGTSLVRSSHYDGLDPTEKGAASYFLGMSVAKLWCSRMLDVPWLFHVSMCETLGYRTRIFGRSEPDLVGLDSGGRWVVAEAKGRSGASDPSVMRKAKNQTRRLRQINGDFPNLRVATQTYFAPDLSIVVHDPDEYDDDARDLNFDVHNTWRRYYSVVTSLADTSLRVTRLEDNDYVTVSVPEVGVTLGLRTGVIRALRSRTEPSLLQEEGSSFAELSTLRLDGFSVYPDGLAVRLDQRWAETRMQLEPTERWGV